MIGICVVALGAGYGSEVDVRVTCSADGVDALGARDGGQVDASVT